MAIWEVVHGGKVHGQNWQSRYHFASSGAGSQSYDAEDILVAFMSEIDPLVRALFTTAGNTNKVDFIRVVNLYDDTDFDEALNLGLNGGGNQGEPVPPFVAVTLRSERLGVGWRRAYKRFPNVGENWISGNSIVPNALTALEAIGDALIDGLQVPTASPIDTAKYVVLRFQKVTDPETGKEHYVKQTTETAQRTNMRIPMSMDYHRPTTQRTRQVGSGT